MPRHLPTTVLLFLLGASVFITPFSRELYVGDETKYSQVVREMRWSGQWFLPTLNGTPFTHKPPLHFWLIDLLTHPLGTYSLWAFVLPSLAAFLWLLWLMRRMGGPLAAFICGSAVMVWGSGQTARMDVTFTALITLAAWKLEQFFEEKRASSLVQAAAVIGVAALVKGPMAPVIFLVLFGLEAFRRRSPVAWGSALGALLVMLIIPMLWVVPAMVMGGEAYRHDVVVKQTVGRAIGSWVHQSPPWYYLLHLPGVLFPWFFMALIAFLARRRGSERERFFIRWIAAVLVPYSLLSSKLDIYMMALIPPVALLIASYVSDARVRDAADGSFATWAKRLNAVQLGILALAGLAGCAGVERWVKGPEHDLAARGEVRGLFVILAIASIIGLVIALRGSLLASTLAIGAVPLVALIYTALFLTPLANEIASTRPLVAALQKQNVDPAAIALYSCPQLWTRAMPDALAHVRYSDADDLGAPAPTVLATSRKHAQEIQGSLGAYHRVDEIRMIGKWFDVYRR